MQPNLMPLPIPGESLFSWASRRHVLYGYGAPWKTCMDLFGHRRLGAQHDLPRRLDQFVQRIDGVLGTAESIIQERTLYPFYQPFRSVDEDSELQARMRGDCVGAIKVSLGLITSRFRANHPLKACPQCLLEDQQFRGFRLWRTAHQFPGVWWCLNHDVALQESAVKSNGVDLNGWMLPATNRLLPPYTVPSMATASAICSIRLLAKACVDIGAMAPDFRVNYARTRSAYRRALWARGWLTRHDWVDWPRACQSYVEFVAPLRAVPELSALAANTTEARRQLSNLFGPFRDRSHPLRHLSVICWLFGTVAAFRCIHDAIDSDSLEWSQPLAVGNDAMPGTPKHSAEKRSSATGEQRGMATSLAALNRVVSHAVSKPASEIDRPNPTYPKKLSNEDRQDAIERLRCGEPIAAVAKSSGRSRKTIDNLRRTVPGLYQAWKDATYAAAFSRARQQWIAAMEASPTSSIDATRLTARWAFGWLYRNERGWLNLHCQMLRSKPGKKRAPFLWNERDSALASQLEAAISGLRLKNGTARVTLQQLCLAVPELRPKLAALERMPRCRRLIAITTGRRNGDGLNAELAL